MAAGTSGAPLDRAQERNRTVPVPFSPTDGVGGTPRRRLASGFWAPGKAVAEDDNSKKAPSKRGYTAISSGYS